MSGFRISGYWTSGSIQSTPVIGRPVWTIDMNRTSDNRTILSGFQTKPVLNRFQTGLEPVSAIRRPVGSNWNRTSDNRRLKLESTGRPITRHLCPVIRRCLKSRGIYNRTLFENAEIRTSGFQTLTVFRSPSENQTKSLVFQ